MSSSVKVHNKSKEERDFERKIGCFLASSSEIFEREGSLKKTWWVGKWYLPSPKLKIYNQGCYTLLNSRLIFTLHQRKLDLKLNFVFLLLRTYSAREIQTPSKIYIASWVNSNFEQVKNCALKNCFTEHLRSFQSKCVIWMNSKLYLKNK